MNAKAATNLLKKMLKEVFNLKKVSVRSDYSSVRIEYTGGVASNIIESYLNRLERGNFNGMIDMYELKPSHKVGLVYDGQELPKFDYLFVNRNLDNEFTHRLLSYVWQNYRFSWMQETPPSLSEMRKFDYELRSDWESYVKHRILSNPSFATQELEKIQFVGFHDNQETGYHYISYTIDGIEGTFYTNKPVYNVEARKNLKAKAVKLPFQLEVVNNKAKVQGHIPYGFLQTLKEMGGEYAHLGNEDVVTFPLSMEDALSDLILDYIQE